MVLHDCFVCFEFYFISIVVLVAESAIDTFRYVFPQLNVKSRILCLKIYIFRNANGFVDSSLGKVGKFPIPSWLPRCYH